MSLSLMMPLKSYEWRLRNSKSRLLRELVLLNEPHHFIFLDLTENISFPDGHSLLKFVLPENLY